MELPFSEPLLKINLKLVLMIKRKMIQDFNLLIDYELF